ncbi:ABC transporter ATP-binding protein [Salmonella enterica subsp. enterica]|uniref:ABC transporter ATP-binding protein n=1 Tax=Salmonella enterica I TaxID=59201 RepID=A0A3S4IWT8_SALET|nr:ABC transporter ATP-binding protein [Salmonella enterica subsp. enterica]
MCCLPMSRRATLTVRPEIKSPTCYFSLNREHGTTLILVTHDPALAARCDRRLRLVNGQLQEEA